MDAIEQFQEAISPFRSTWSSLDVRVLGDIQSNLLLSMIACLTPEEPRPPEEVERTADIVFIRGRTPIASLDNLLDGLRSGAVPLGRFRFESPDFPAFDFQPLDRPPHEEDLVIPWSEYRDFPRFALYAWGRRNIEAMVRSRDLWAAARVQGFSSFGEMSSKRLGFAVGSSISTRVRMFAPILASIEAKPESGTLPFTMRFHRALNPENLSVSYRVQDDRGDRVDGGRIARLAGEPAPGPVMSSLDSSLPLKEEAATVELRLYHSRYTSGEEPLATFRLEVPRRVAGENPRWDLLKSLVGNTRTWNKSAPEETLRQWAGLSTPRPQDDLFEKGINCLLFLAGCASLHLGAAEGVDLAMLDTEPNKLAFLISCTTSSNIQNKVPNLNLQANYLRDRLPGYTVRGVVFTPVELRDLTIGAIQDCQGANIGIVLREQIGDLFETTTGRDWLQAKDELLRILTAPSPDSIPSFGSGV